MKTNNKLEKGIYINIWTGMLILLFILLLFVHKNLNLYMTVILYGLSLLCLIKICLGFFFGIPVMFYKKVQGLLAITIVTKEYMSMLVYNNEDGKLLYDSAKYPDLKKSEYYLAELEKNRMNKNYNFKYRITMVSYKKPFEKLNVFISAKWQAIITKNIL